MSTEAPAWWTKDLERHNTALRDGGWLIEIEGEKFLDPSTPERLQRTYRQVVSVGYYNGWL